jgi:hypothetical protein
MRGPWRDDAASVTPSVLRLAGHVAGMERGNGHDLVIETGAATAWLRCAKCGGHWDLSDRRREDDCRAEGPLPPWPGIYAAAAR